jgi:hypothetical protein
VVPLILLLRRQRQEDDEFKASLSKVSKILSQKQNTNERTGCAAQQNICLAFIRHWVQSPVLEKIYIYFHEFSR